MRSSLVTLVCSHAFIVALTGACGHSHSDSELLGEVVLLDNASDEALESLADTFEQVGATVSATASSWVAPDEGPLSRASVPTFEWSAAGVSARHGVVTGRFVWLRLTAAGDAEPVDVTAVETTEVPASTTFTPTATQWTRLAAGATLSGRLVTAQLDDTRVVLGPFQDASPTRAFSIVP